MTTGQVRAHMQRVSGAKRVQAGPGPRVSARLPTRARGGERVRWLGFFCSAETRAWGSGSRPARGRKRNWAGWDISAQDAFDPSFPFSLFVFLYFSFFLFLFYFKHPTQVQIHVLTFFFFQVYEYKSY
jgi:hypothetical protein